MKKIKHQRGIIKNAAQYNGINQNISFLIAIVHRALNLFSILFLHISYLNIDKGEKNCFKPVSGILSKCILDTSILPISLLLHMHVV